MVLTDRQRKDLHAGIYEYLAALGDEFGAAATAFAAADPDAANRPKAKSGAPLLEKKWTAIPRLQKKVLELERVAAQSAKIHAHRTGGDNSVGSSGARRMLPRQPAGHTLKGHSMGVTAVAVHPIFTVVASGSEDGTIKVWDHENGDYMRTLKGHTNTVNAVTFTPKGTHLASCSTDLSIKLWDFRTYTCLRTLRGHDHTISAVIFVPLPNSISNPNAPSSGGARPGGSGAATGMDAAVSGCQQLLSASRDATVKMWDVESGFCDHTFGDHTGWVRCLAVRQSDGAVWASAGNDTTIRVYDSSSKASVAELRGHEHVVESLAFVTEEPLKVQSNGTKETKHIETVRDYLASGSRDKTVRLWKIADSSCTAVFKSHENWVQGVVIHPSGNYVISCSDDKSIRVFDIKAQRCLRTLEKAHDHFVTTLQMHHTLPILVSGSVDQTIRCWPLD